MGFRIVNATTRETLPGIPTPRLIEAGRAEAFEKDGVWFLREDGTMHVSPTGEYTNVLVRHTEDYRVDVHIRVADASVDETDKDALDAMEWDDYFIVEAVDRQDAESQAYTKAHDEVERQWGVPDEPGFEGSVVDIIRVQKGVSI